MEMTKAAAILMAFLAFVVHSGSAIRCWDCNSKFDPRCGHGHFDNHTLETVDCDQISYTHLGNAKAKYCRKVIQYIEGTERTIRSCGWLDDARAITHDGCYSRTGTKDIMITFCTCEADSCNSAPRRQTTAVWSSLVLTFVNSFLTLTRVG
ncbi:U-scoloptoxin(05)-Sm1a [Hyalella azteca]|uniref:U-scoloptoxin(05)-Sm1a n=1 Tax=Hyalella azteca TaxID=294128 RepID=A0A8B7N8A7_HYAAZ|nr:U-scoloptoxin(05)-Sm1a [Hyalella azteca]